MREVGVGGRDEKREDHHVCVVFSVAVVTDFDHICSLECQVEHDVQQLVLKRTNAERLQSVCADYNVIMEHGDVKVERADGEVIRVVEVDTDIE